MEARDYQCQTNSRGLGVQTQASRKSNRRSQLAANTIQSTGCHPRTVHERGIGLQRHLRSCGQACYSARFLGRCYEVWLQAEIWRCRNCIFGLCRLLKGVPGIPQGSRLFFETFAAELKLMGYLPSTADKCLFVKNDSSERTAFIVWVDDFVFLHEKEETWEKTIARLRQRFTIPAAGPLTCFLGMQIIYSPKEHTMFISQANTIQVLLERSGLADCNPGLIPCQPGSVFSVKDCPTPTSNRATEYSSLVALANFLACWTRPDIAFAVNKLCKFMANPGETIGICSSI